MEVEVEMEMDGVEKDGAKGEPAHWRKQ